MSRLISLHRFAVLLLVISAGLVFADDGEEKAAVPVPPEAPAEPSPAEESQLPETHHLVSWLESFERARELGRIRRSPILVIAGAEWCGPCRMLEAELEQPVVQEQLERCVAVHLDVDDHPDAAEELAVSSIPAMRVLSPDGRLLASREGVMSADELAEWLSDHFDDATDDAGDGSTKGKMTALVARRMMRSFRSQEATVRESAISRLAAIPGLAAPFVVASMSDGNLSEKLSCLELLTVWDAPVDDLDPWVPETVTADRIGRLETWLDASEFRTPTDGDELSPAQLMELERLLSQLVNVDAVAAAAIREQIARYGSRSLPLILDAIDEAADDRARQSLNAARFRVVSSAELELNWPGGIERLASSDYDVRVAAAMELSQRATKHDDQLLAELLRDPMPLIREIGMEGLSGISGSSSNGALAKLLDDPDANVRAAVLKRLADKPTAVLAPRVAAYIEHETDPDLVVHAVRFLREVKSPHSVKALSALLDHSSWRVRAESAEGLSKLVEDRYGEGTTAGMRGPLKEKFQKLLSDEDDFVVGRAIAGLAALKANSVVTDIIGVAAERESLTRQVVRSLGAHFASEDAAEDFLRDMCLHASGDVRAEAIRALVKSHGKTSSTEIQDCLNDTESRVRIATADAMFEQAALRIRSRMEAFRENASATNELGSTEFDVSVSDGGFISSALGAFGSLFGGFSSLSTDEDDSMEDPELPADEEESPPDADDVDSPNNPDQEVRRIRSEQDLDDWLYDHTGDLLVMLQARDPSERLSAARLLAVLDVEDGLPVLLKSADEPTNLMSLLMTFPGLLWEERSPLFDRIIATSRSHADRLLAAEALAATLHPQSPDLLWPLLARDDADHHFAGQLQDFLKQSYSSTRGYYVNHADAAAVKHLANDSRQMLAEGTIWQRTLGLSLLAESDREAGLTAAKSILEDVTQPESWRNDALRVILFHSEPDAATEKAVEILSSQPAGGTLAESAVRYLALEQKGVGVIAESVELTLSNALEMDFYRNAFGSSDDIPEWIVPHAPAGLTVEQVLPFVQSDNQATQLSAAYLLVLLGEADYLPELVSSWTPGDDDEELRRLVYRAIAVSNDSTFVPVLERIYREIIANRYNSNVADFYWTIRAMKGPEVLALRKRIRKEVDADELRGQGY